MDSNATNQRIAWFKREEESGTLDLSPQFQRRPVWTDEQSSFLIDTILSNLPIPEIYIRSSSNSDGSSRYEVVDGQQRIRAILKFGSNDLELEGEEVAARWLGYRFEDLDDATKMRFWDYRLVVRDVNEASDTEIRDLFRRLNLNSITLNDQELRHSQLSGIFIKTMEALADDEWWIENKIFNIRQVRRMEDVEYVSELFIGLVAGPQEKKSTLDEYYENFDQTMPDKAEWTKHFNDTVALIRDTMSETEIKQWSGKSDFYTLFLAMGQLARKRIATTQRQSIASALARFRNAVDAHKKKGAPPAGQRDVAAYIEAVTRAATDRNRREIRLQVLEARLSAALAASRPLRRPIRRR